MKAYFCYSCQKSFVHPFPVSSPTSATVTPNSDTSGTVSCFYCHSEFIEELGRDVSQQLIPGILHDQSVYAAQHGRIFPPSSPPLHNDNNANEEGIGQGTTDNPRVYQYNNGNVYVSVQVLDGGGVNNEMPIGAMLGAFQRALPVNFLAEGTSILTPLFQAVGITDGDPREFVHDPHRYREFMDRLMQRLVPNLSPRQASGLTDTQLTEIPLVTSTEGDCAICREPHSAGIDADSAVEIRKLPCGHTFHQSCIFPWLKRVPSCPMCRKPLINPDSTSSTNTGHSNDQNDSRSEPNFTIISDNTD